MTPAKLACLINDTYDALERSKIGAPYLRDANGNVIKTPEGCPWCNMASMQVFTTALQAQIIKEKYED